MSTDILQRFLSCKLLNLGAADDTRLERVRKAAKEVGEGILKRPRVTIRYALVAFDPNIQPDDPTLIEVAQIVEKHWNTYASCFADVPRTLFRAVILEALRQALGENDGIACAVALLARNVLPHLELKGEQGIWTDLISAADDCLNDRAFEDWRINSEIKLPSIQLQQPKTNKKTSITFPKIDVGAIQNGFNVSIGQRNAIQAANFVANAIDTVLSGVVVDENQDNTMIESIQSFRKLANGLVTASTGQLKSIHLRTQLLWWKESLYSPSCKTSYRNLSTVGASAVMALDLHDYVPSFYPPSVEAFLSETAKNVIGSDVKKRTLSQLVSELIANKSLSAFHTTILKYRQQDGRRPLVALIAEGIGGTTITGDHLLNALGLGERIKLSLSEFAVWIFRELQAYRALEEDEEEDESDEDESDEDETSDGEKEDEK